MENLCHRKYFSRFSLIRRKSSETQILTLKLTPNLTLAQTLPQTLILNLKKFMKNARMNISHSRFTFLT